MIYMNEADYTELRLCCAEGIESVIRTTIKPYSDVDLSNNADFITALSDLIQIVLSSANIWPNYTHPLDES